jgi:hypothetical protein
MEGGPPGSTMEDRHEIMLEEKVCTQPERIIALPEEAIIMFYNTDCYFVHVN